MRFATLWAAVLAVMVCMSGIVLQSSVALAFDEPDASVPSMNPAQVTALLDVLAAWPELGSEDVFGAWTEASLQSACDGTSVYGISACNASGFVTELLFTDGVNPSGPLPDAISQLTALTVFSSYGPVNGTLPASWSTLTDLSTLILSNSLLTGAIPPSWSNLQSLSQLTLEWLLPGEASNPDEDVPSDGVEYEDNVASTNIVQWNAGALPLNSLTVINFVNLNLGASPLPAELFTSPTLQTLTLDGVAWDGSVPTGLFSNTHLYSFILEALPFSATASSSFPSDWSSMTSMSAIRINSVSWLGDFPTSFASALSSLQLLDWPNLTGSLPQSLVDLPLLHLFVLSNIPQLGGNLPTPTNTSASALTTLYFDYVGFTGTIGGGLFSLPKLTTLYITNIQNWGAPTLPEAGNCRLNKVIMYNSRIAGSIPASIANNCTVLNYLDLNFNSLTGSIPELWRNRLFNTLNLAHNELTGTLPHSLATKLIAYGYFDVSDNQLNGIIDVAYVDKGYIAFNLSHNQFDLCSNAANISDNVDILSGAAFCQIDSQASNNPCDCVGAWPNNCLSSDACAASAPSDSATPSDDEPVTFAPDGSVIESPSSFSPSAAPSSQSPSHSSIPSATTPSLMAPTPTNTASSRSWSSGASIFVFAFAMLSAVLLQGC